MTCLADDTVLAVVEGRMPLADHDEHLDGCAACREVIAQVARAHGGLPCGHLLGRYVIGDLIGSGAMGRVYSAWEPELDRRVAIKVLQSGTGSALVREAQAMARLNHPNVVTVHEVGTTADAVFVAMELVDGESLRTWAEGRRWREVTRVLVELARGLAAVHAAGVIHRDIKPDNVIVGRDGRPRLGDFGLASAGHALGTAGTPAYMSPEVLRGAAGDAASDQFSFGVTAYELLAGKRPFSGTSWAELLAAMQRPPAPLAVPGWLDRAIRRCLAVDPAQRFASLGALADHLAARLARRRPLAIFAALGAALIASTVTWLALPREAAACAVGAREIAAVTARPSLGAPATAAVAAYGQRWVSERDNACDAPARIRCLEERRAELAALLDRATSETMTAPGSDRIVDALVALPSPAECRAPDAADPLPLDPERAVLARESTAELPALRAAAALGEGSAVVERTAATVARARQSQHAPTLADALLVQAEVARGAGDRGLARAAAREAVVVAERGHADHLAARGWLLRAGIESDRRELATAEDFAELAGAAVQRANAGELGAAVLLLRGTIAYNRGQLDAARALLEDARAQFTALVGARSVEVANVDAVLGSVARAAGDLPRAEQLLGEALELDRALHGPTHSSVARDLHNVAGVQRLRGQLDAATASYRAALALEHGADAGLTHNSLGLVAMARGEWTAARTELAAALELLADDGDRALAEHNLGIVAAALGDHATALAHFARAAAIYVATIGDAAPAALRLPLDQARSELALGHLAAARELATRAQHSGVSWLAEDATTLLGELPRSIPARPLTPHVPHPLEPVAAEPHVTTSPIAEPTLPQPPKRDVGVYGAHK